MPDPSAPELPADPSPHPPPRTYLGWSVAASALCFLPLGLVAVAYGLRADRAVAAGNLDRAARFSRVARRWLIAAAVLGLLLWATLTVSLFLLGASSG